MTTPRRHAARAATATPTRVAHLRAARAVAVDVERRVIDALVIPYGEAASVSDDGGRTFYDETFAAGGATAADTVPVYAGHENTRHGVERGPWIGGALNSTETPEGLRAELEIGRTPEGDRVLEAARILGRVHVSAEYELPTVNTTGAAVVRSADADSVIVDGIAVLLPPQLPAFASAGGTSARAARAAAGDEDDDENEDAEDDAGEGDDAGDTDAARAALPELVRREVARYAGRGSARAVPRSPFAVYRDLDAAVSAARNLPAQAAAALRQAFADAYHDWSTARAARAWVDQITADNPGVMQPTWLQTVFGIIDEGRPAITALGGPTSAGDSGLELNWPYYDGDLRTLVAKQLAEKTEVTSVKVSLKKGTADLETFAGGSDVSYQLIRRSRPSYLETYNRIMNLAYALVTEAQFEIDLAAAGVGVGVFDPTAADADGAALRAWLVKASIAVKRATGRPATVVLAATDAWSAIASRPWLMAPQYGTQNVPGTSSAAGLTVDVSGLPIIEAPDLPTKAMIATNSSGASWVEDGPFLVTAEDVPKLGRDVAVWGLGGTAVFSAAGVAVNKAGAVAAKADAKA